DLGLRRPPETAVPHPRAGHPATRGPPGPAPERAGRGAPTGGTAAPRPVGPRPDARAEMGRGCRLRRRSRSHHAWLTSGRGGARGPPRYREVMALTEHESRIRHLDELPFTNRWTT